MPASRTSAYVLRSSMSSLSYSKATGVFHLPLTLFRQPTLQRSRFGLRSSSSGYRPSSRQLSRARRSRVNVAADYIAMGSELERMLWAMSRIRRLLARSVTDVSQVTIPAKALDSPASKRLRFGKVEMMGLSNTRALGRAYSEDDSLRGNCFPDRCTLHGTKLLGLALGTAFRSAVRKGRAFRNQR